MEQNNEDNIVIEDEEFFDPCLVIDSETKYYITPDNKPEEICFFKDNPREYCSFKFVEVDDEGRYDNYTPMAKQGYKLYISKKQYIKIVSIISKALRRYSLFTYKLNIPVRETIVIDILHSLSYKDIRALSRGKLSASEIYRRLRSKELNLKAINVE